MSRFAANAPPTPARCRSGAALTDGGRIRVRALGVAAGGGLPQWNCGCVNCADARAGKIRSLTQSSVAIRGSQGECFLINASPDLSSQLARYGGGHPISGARRGNPIDGVLLTNADLDHALGIFSLREGDRLQIYATEAVRCALDESLGMTGVMEKFCGVTWNELPENEVAALGAKGKQSSLMGRAIRLPGGPPIFANGRHKDGAHSVAYFFVDRETGGRLLVAPDVSGFNTELEKAMSEADAVLFDGTFWSGDELRSVKPNARTAEEMGHVPIKDGSLAKLAALKARHKILIHINNTNPVLSPDSPERKTVEAAGVVVGYDGLEFEL